jgi:SAM-dependent methyltransferase
MSKFGFLLGDSTDRSWESHGRREAYYGVLATDRFRNANLSESVIAEFMLSGEGHIDDVLGYVERNMGPVRRGRALDFGCGVGRLLLPLARRFEQAVGLDISDSMLAETQRNAEKAGVSNISVAHSPDELPPGETYDFIHTVIVLQHIPLARGEALIAALLSRLTPGGVAALHVNLKLRRTRLRAFCSFLRRNFTPLNVPANLLSGRPWNEPMMQMNEYRLDRLYQIGLANGFTSMLVWAAEIPQASQAFVLFRRD